MYGYGYTVRRPATHKAVIQGYQVAAEVLGKKESKKLENNTYLERRNLNTIVVRLHKTDVVTYHADGSIELNTGGWKTSTTKDRINSYAPVVISQMQSVWYISKGKARMVFKDGMRITGRGDLEGGDSIESVKTINEIKRKLKSYSLFLFQSLIAGKMTHCWMCFTASGEDEISKAHLQTHIDKKEAPTEILLNMQQMFPGMPQTVEWFVSEHLQMSSKELEGRFYDGLARQVLTKNLARYLYRKFGLAS